MSKQEKLITLGRSSDGALYQKSLKDIGSMLLSGVPGVGKSTLLQHIAEQASKQAQVLIIDPKKICYLPFKQKENCKVITNEEDFPKLLQKLIEEINNRYATMERENTDVCKYRHIICIIDECALLFQSLSANEKDQIRQVLALGRQCNITMIVATQSPSRRLLTGDLVDMFTTKCALKAASAYASRIVLSETGAQNLPRYSALFVSADGFKVQLRLLPPDIDKQDAYQAHDTIEWDD